MNRKTLEQQIGVLTSQILKSTEDWEKRRDALVSLQNLIDEAGRTGQAGPTVFTADVWRLFKEPLKNTLNDLRSAIVKEACSLIEKLSTATGDLLRALMRDIVNVLLQLVANGNSVIVGHVDSCMKHVIGHSCFPRQLKDFEYTIKNSKSKHLHEALASYARLMLEIWPPAMIDKEAGHLEAIIEVLLADASSAARTDGRASFAIFKTHWPKRADKIYERADPRTAKQLREASTPPARRSKGFISGSAGSAASGARPSQLPSGGTGSGSRRPSTAESSRGQELGVRGNGQVLSSSSPHSRHQGTARTSAVRRGVSSSVPDAAGSSPASPGVSKATRKVRPRTAPPGRTAGGSSPKLTSTSRSHTATGGGGRGEEGLASGIAINRLPDGLTGGGGGSAGSSTAPSETASSFAEGDKVRLKGSKPRSAVVRYVGTTQFASGVWVGVELVPGAEPAGNNDGTVNSVRYFECPPARGIFARPDMVEPDHTTTLRKDLLVDQRPFDLRSAEVVGNMENEGVRETEDPSRGAGHVLMRCHKIFTNELLEALHDELAVIPSLESVLDTDKSVPTEQLQSYHELLESAADAREASAARLRAHLADAVKKYPTIFGHKSDETAEVGKHLRSKTGTDGVTGAIGGEITAESNGGPFDKEGGHRDPDDREGSTGTSVATAATADAAEPTDGGDDAAEAHSTSHAAAVTPPAAPNEKANEMNKMEPAPESQQAPRDAGAMKDAIDDSNSSSPEVAPGEDKTSISNTVDNPGEENAEVAAPVVIKTSEGDDASKTDAIDSATPQES